ncbi:glutathione S-transferase [Motilimonas eburnea]|uniref:glutathione S-transferase n=1 Tax=Motilimonas eburnea TaxID=1737488 RepID=UPI001E3019D2|nr:glutathione S-transferase [Motilimonas eburnea]MCE2570439.1 glutathione S-transferase [Motilimonas eburnea]
MTPILYSFRRCPYAMRARLAIAASHQVVQLREIVLKHKPQEMLAISPKGTIPVLQLSTGEVIDESLDIMLWALHRSDPLTLVKNELSTDMALIKQNDHDFKPWLDKYKYADRHPELSQRDYQDKACEFIDALESNLSKHQYLTGDQLSLADLAIAPFIRQFTMVDSKWFDNAPYPLLRRWLNDILNSALFKSAMKKYPTWLESGQTFNFPESSTA